MTSGAASYKSLDIDRYKFVATLDTRTSTICQKLDGKVFETKGAQAGKNLPSMHPNCRSTTIPNFEDGMPEIRVARDKDGNRIKVPADMTYPEWYEKYIKPSEGGNGSQKSSAPSKGKDTGGSGKESPVSVPPVGAEVNDRVASAERTELLSRNPVDIHNSSIDNSGGSGIIELGSEAMYRKPKPDKIAVLYSLMMKQKSISTVKMLRLSHTMKTQFLFVSHPAEQVCLRN